MSGRAIVEWLMERHLRAGRSTGPRQGRVKGDGETAAVADPAFVPHDSESGRDRPQGRVRFWGQFLMKVDTRAS
jgi:hypothetical protein